MNSRKECSNKEDQLVANRILKDSIWDSSTLAGLPDFIEDQFPRWLLLADDWGCFCADAETVKGKVYPKRPKVTAKTVEEIRLAFYQAGLLFCWQEGERVWGFWTNFGSHNYLTSVDDEGTRLKLRRRTPEPPRELLTEYMSRYGTPKDEKGPRAAPWDIAGQDGTLRNKTANPDPDLDPDPDPNSNLQGKGVVVEAPPVVTPGELIEIWENNRGEMTPCISLTEKRKTKCRTRIAERQKEPESFRLDFLASVRKASAIPFFAGAGDRGWKGNFDWFIENDTNYLKILEGKYDGVRRERESEAQARQRRTREASHELFRRVDEQAGGGVSTGNLSRDAGDVSAVALGFAAGST